MSEILIWGWSIYIAAFFEGRGFVKDEFEDEPLVLMVVVIVIEGIVFFEERGFVRSKSEGEPLVLIVLIVVEEIVFFERRRFVRDRSEDILMIVVVVVEGIMFFEGRRFVRGRSEGEPLVIVVIMVEKIVFAVFNSGNIRNLIVSITMNLTNSIISLLIASEKYEG
jgi:hypothetical protein